MKPGKPIYFGVRGKKLVFGLPGNPVAALLTFHLLVRPALEKLTGASSNDRLSIDAILSTDLRKKAERIEFVRAVLLRDDADRFIVTPTGGQESHMMGGIAAANCLLRFPKESEFIPKGSAVKAELIHWYD